MADQAGFCFGVKRAVDKIEEALRDQKEVWSIGMPIHNSQEVARLKRMGLRVANDVNEIPQGATVLIRAHGETPAVLRDLHDIGAQVTDTTCPFVRRAQTLAKNFSSQGYQVVLLGDRDHPEIRSIMGYVEGSSDVVGGPQDAQKLPSRSLLALISQTTQQEERLAEVAAVLTTKASELHVCNTICKATVERQEAVRRLRQVDGIVIIGGRESANTAKLRDIAAASGMDVVWIENADEIDGRWLVGKNRIGIAAGASTPQWLINEICNKIARM